jgi:pimeloyl-ACP methyl ester carboxylesterase
MRRFASVAAAMALAAAGPAMAGEPVELQAPGPQGPLAGTMIDAGAGAPVMLMIPGSGPTDRNGNSPAGITAAPYRLLAQGLAERGISTVRVDKRGMFGSAAAGNPNAVTVAGYVQDIRSWVATIRERTGARCAWVMGHSEGVLMALAAAAENAQGICGIVLVSGAGRRLSDVLREQLRAAPPFAPHLDAAFAAFERLEAGQRVDTAGMSPILLTLLAPQVQDYLIDNFAHDPAELASRVRVPMLVVQGLSDLQTSETDARRIAAANREARLVLLPDVNHVLKRAPRDDRAANIATYANPDLPLADGVVEAIADFIRR